MITLSHEGRHLLLPLWMAVHSGTTLLSSGDLQGSRVATCKAFTGYRLISPLICLGAVNSAQHASDVRMHEPHIIFREKKSCHERTACKTGQRENLILPEARETVFIRLDDFLRMEVSDQVEYTEESCTT